MDFCWARLLSDTVYGRILHRPEAAMIMSNELFFLIGGTVFVLYIVFMAIWLHGPIGHEKQRQLQLTQIWNKVRALVEKREADPHTISFI